ncbi:MAG: hypothetical protein ACRC1H_07170, partial [Caldilineaceae bacterium]
AAVARFRANLAVFKGRIKHLCGVQVAAALNNVVDIAIAGNQVAFAFAQNPFARDIIAKPETLAVVVEELTKILGSSVTLDCQLGSKAKLQASAQMAGGAPTGSPDDLVTYAIEELRAEVKERADTKEKAT